MSVQRALQSEAHAPLIRLYSRPKRRVNELAGKIRDVRVRRCDARSEMLYFRRWFEGEVADLSGPDRANAFEEDTMAGDFRIAVIGQAAFGESVLKALVERGENVVAALCAPDREGRPHDLLKVEAERHGISVLQFRRMRNQDAVDAFKALNTDLCVMAFVTDVSLGLR